MISQTDATLSAATTTTPATTNLHLHHHLQQQHLLHHQQQQQLNEQHIDTSLQLHHHTPTTTTTHNGKTPKPFSTKRKKKFEETIVDGFAIIAFKTWEDLQDELNSHTTTTFDTTNNLTADNSKKADIKNSKTHSTSSSSSSTASSNPDHFNATSDEKDSKKKDKKKTKETQFKNHSSSQKDKQRNKSSSDKNSLKKALEGKKLAEKRLSILQEKLKLEKSKNKSNSNNSVNINHNTTNTNNNNNNNNNQHAEPSISNSNIGNQHSHQDSVASNQQHHSQHPPPQPIKQHQQLQQHIKTGALHNQDVHFSSNSHTLTATHHIIKEEIHHSQIRSDSLLQPDLLADQSLPSAKSAPFPSFLPVVHAPRAYSTNIHQMPVYNAPQSPSTLPHLTQANQGIRQPVKQLIQAQHSSTSLPPHPLMSQHQSTPPPTAPLVPQLAASQQMHPQYHRSPHPSLLHHPMPYPQAQQSSMLSMGLNTLPSPYTCPPSIYITDTFSRQTSIIPPPQPPPPPPPPVLGSVLDPTSAASQAARYGHSNVMHSMTPYNPAVTPHHSMYYPTLPTERSFLEFARTYTGPGHIGYPNLMNSFPTSNPANSFRFDRWPRAILDQQRAANRYSSLYQGAATIPDRAYSSYTTPRPPSFPASLFPPPF